MKKQELIDAILAEVSVAGVQLTKKQAKAALSALISVISKEVAANKEIRIDKFGKFFIRTIKTGLPEGHPLLPSGVKSLPQGRRNVMTFKCSKSIKDLLN